MRKKAWVWVGVVPVFLLLAATAVGQKQKPEFKEMRLNLPDLRVTIQCPGSVQAGEELDGRIAVSVQNAGSAAAGAFNVDLVLSGNASVPVTSAAYSANYHDDVLLLGGREGVPSLAAGASLPLALHGKNKIPNDTPEGSYYLAAVIDSGNGVRELNESNNVALCPVRVTRQALPDLTVTGFAFTGAPPGNPPECRLLVTIVNLGPAPIPHGTGVTLQVYVNDVLVETIDIDSSSVEQTAFHDVHNAYDPANPGKSRSVVGTHYIFPASATSRTYRCRGVIDPGGVLGEGNEGNNSFSRDEIIPAH